MIGQPATLLALTVTDGAFACAEVAAKSGGRARASGVFSWPTGVRLEQADALGQAFRDFLRAQGFTAKQAVVGIPARWVLAQERELPPIARSEALAVLQLQAEKLTASDAAELTFDFVGEPSATAASRVLMVGTLRRRLDQLEAALAAAGLRVRSITPTILSLPAVTRGGADDSLVMLVGSQGAELVWQQAGRPRTIQHVPVSMNGHGRSMTMLGAEVRRSAAMPQGGDGGRAEMFDAVGLTPEELSKLTESLGPGVRLQTAAAVGTDPRLAPAAALGVAAAESRLLVDFRHSRLAVAPRKRITRAGAWGIAVGAALLLAILVEVVTYRQDRAELFLLEQQLSQLSENVASAEATITRSGFARRFYENRTAPLSCLTELTRAFGEYDAVWATGVTFRQDGRGTLMGAGADQPAVLSLVDRLKNNRAFRNVAVVDMRDATSARSREVSFTITFTYVAASATPEGAP